jgi:hypothetical protein
VQTFNAITSAVFDVILAPFGHRAMWFDLLFWPILAGVVALLIYKAVSNQAGIADAKRRITVHLLEVRLYRDDLLGVLKSTALGLAQNARYLGYNVLPMLVMFVPMTIILVQLVANYAYDPLQRGDVKLLEVDLAQAVRPSGKPWWWETAPARCRWCGPRPGRRCSIQARPRCLRARSSRPFA